MTPRERAPRVLVVDDEPSMAEMLADGLSDRGFEAEAIGSGARALERVKEGGVDALVTDLRMPDVDGIELCARSRAAAPDVPVLVMTAYGAIDTAMESIRQGAYHYLTKPFKLDELVLFLGRALDEVRLRREASALKSTLRERFSPEGIVGSSRAMRALLDLVTRVAPSDVNVLLVGETGTGKGLLARTIHAQSARASARFVTVNCAALPDALLESELFGHVRGAFTGATSDRPGLFAEADGGTIFLDEIAEMSPALQAKLLDVIERRRVRAVGSSKEREIDARILAATHRDLAERARAGPFREDLRFRRDVVTLELPALRHRREDIPPPCSSPPRGHATALRPSPPSRARRSRACSTTRGPATCASCRTRSSARCCSATPPRCGSPICRPRSARRRRWISPPRTARSCPSARCSGATPRGRSRSSAAARRAPRRSSAST